MISLALTVVMCSGTGQTVAECEPTNLAVYETQTWLGPTEADMEDCVSQAETLNLNGNNARCHIDSADKDDYAPASYPAPKVSTKWTF